MDYARKYNGRVRRKAIFKTRFAVGLRYKFDHCEPFALSIFVRLNRLQVLFLVIAIAVVVVVVGVVAVVVGGGWWVLRPIV